MLLHHETLFAQSHFFDMKKLVRSALLFVNMGVEDEYAKKKKKIMLKMLENPLPGFEG
jgi:hypothetical protein